MVTTQFSVQHQRYLEYYSVSTFSEARNASTASKVDYDRFIGNHYFSPTARWTLVRWGVTFDTSTLPSLANIKSAKIKLYCNSKIDQIASSHGLYSFSPASKTSFVATDYNDFGTTAYTLIDTTSVTVSAYNDFAIPEAYFGDIVKGGSSTFGFRESRDASNNPQSTGTSGYGDFYNDYADANPPLLEVTYTLPSSGNPAFFSGGGLTIL